MGLSTSRPPRDGVYAHLRDQARLIADLQTYLNRIDKLLADSEAAHKQVRHAVESFFPADAPTHDVVFRLMQSMKVFEQVRIDLRSQTNCARKTFQTLLDKLHHLERLVKERDRLSRKVEATEKILEKLRSKSNVNPSPAFQKRLAKAEGQYNALHREFKLKEAETRFEASSAMDSKYAEAAAVVSQCALVIIQYVQITAPEMEKANHLLALLQPSTGGLQTIPFRPLADTLSAAPVCGSEKSDLHSSGAESLGHPYQSPCQTNQQPSVPRSVSKRMEYPVKEEGNRELPENGKRQTERLASTTTPSLDVTHSTGITTGKDDIGVPIMGSSDRTPIADDSASGNPFENDI